MTPKCEEKMYNALVDDILSRSWFTGTSETKTRNMECTSSVGVKLVRIVSPEVVAFNCVSWSITGR